MQVLRDVVTAVAGTDYERGLAAPCLAIMILTGMQYPAGEILQRRDVRHICDAANAGCYHDMPWMHRAPAAVGSAQHHSPSSFRLMVGAAFEFCTGPVVQLHGVDIGFEPVGELVLG